MTYPDMPPVRRSAALRTMRSLSLIIGILTSGPAMAQIVCPQDNSTGTPIVHQQHIFCGEINKKNKAVGFHSRPGGLNPATVTNTPAPVPTALSGIYELFNFNITENGITKVKARSTVFPDACSQADVIAAIQNAYTHRTSGGPNKKFQGPSGTACLAGFPPASFSITGYADSSGEIITAWPQ